MIERGVDERVEVVVGHGDQHVAAQLLPDAENRQVPPVAGRPADDVDEAPRPPGGDDAGQQDVANGPDRCVLVPGEVVVHRAFGLEVVGDICPLRRLEPGDGHGIDDGGAQRAHVGEGPIDERPHLLVVVRVGIGLRVHRLANDADARPAQALGVEPGGVGLGHVADCIRGDRIVGVVAGDGVEQEGGVPHRPGHGAERIAGRVGRHHPETADQRQGGAQADQRVNRGRAADGAAGVLADAHHAEVGGDARAGAARGAARIAGRIVGVADDPERRSDITGRELAHVRLGEDEGARRAHPDDDGCVATGHEPVEQRGAVGGRQVARLHLVLQQHRDAVQRANRSRLRVGCVELVGPFQRAGVDHLDGVQVRAGLVVGFDPVDVSLDQRATGQLARRERGMHVRDGRLEQLEALGARGGRDKQPDGDGNRHPARSAYRSRAVSMVRRPASVSRHGASSIGRIAAGIRALCHGRSRLKSRGGPPRRRPGAWTRQPCHVAVGADRRGRFARERRYGSSQCSTGLDRNVSRRRRTSSPVWKRE